MTTRFSLSLGTEYAHNTPVNGDTGERERDYPALSAGGDFGIELELPCESYEPECKDNTNTVQFSIMSQATGLFGRKYDFVTNEGATRASGVSYSAADFHNNVAGFRVRAYKGLGTPKLQVGFETALGGNIMALKKSRSSEPTTHYPITSSNDSYGEPSTNYFSGITYEIAAAFRFSEVIQLEFGPQILINNALENGYGSTVVPAFKAGISVNAGILLSKAIRHAECGQNDDQCR